MEKYDFTEYYLRFIDLSKIAQSNEFKLRDDIMYYVIDFDYDGSAIIELEDGKTFALMEEEMEYVELVEERVELLHMNELDEDSYKYLKMYDEFLNFNPMAYAIFDNELENARKEKTTISEKELERYINEIEYEVNKRYLDSEIDRLLLEPNLNVQELSRLVGIKYPHYE